MQQPSNISGVIINKIISLNDIYIILGLCVPGIIIMFVRSQFIPCKNQISTANILPYFIISIVYYAAIAPIMSWVLSFKEVSYGMLVAWFAIIFVCPASVGLLVGVSFERGWLRGAMRACGINTLHVMPTAWDWKFGKKELVWVLVTLKDGSCIRGFCGPDSFMSTDPTERDIYIQWLYKLDNDDEWISCGETGILIVSGEIKTIRFWSYDNLEKNQ